MNLKSNDSLNIVKADTIKMAGPKILHGKAAIAAVEKVEGKLNPLQAYIVSLEGYAPPGVDYDDLTGAIITDLNTSSVKGVSTGGVGQTGPYKGEPFKEVVAKFEEQVRNTIPGYDSLPFYLQKELVQSAYRGDLGFSPLTVELFNKGSFSDASQEFLKNKNYITEKAKEKVSKKQSDIAKRIKATSDAIDRYGRDVYSDDLDKELGEVESDKKPGFFDKVGQTGDILGSMVGLGSDRERTVEAGDTAAEVARELGVRVEDLGGLGKDPNLIHPGDVLTAPPEEKTWEEEFEDLKRVWGLYEGGIVDRADVSERIHNIMKPRN
jgi:nucleoid-associated protein YgaU